MAEELFNQNPLQSTIAGDERIAFGKPGEVGCRNITYAQFLALIQGATPLKVSFDNTALDAGDNYSLTVNHGNNTLYPGVLLYDNNGVQQPTDGLFQVIDANNVKFTFNDPIDGTWRYLLTFV